YKYHQHASWFPTFTQDDTSALGATPDMFFAAPPVAFVMFFAAPPVALVALSACALAALTVYRVTVTIAVNNIEAVIANDVCLCIKSCSIDADI
ncbi:MAG: hypothetical protein WAK17_25450, partial [Candidatus Nitrosopolaris sp.]